MSNKRRAFSSHKKRNVVKKLVRRGCRCAYCGKELSDYDRTIDHVIPRSLGGSNAMRNLVLACRRCNGTKSSQLLKPFGPAYQAGRKKK